jgi:hypothetical protein
MKIFSPYASLGSLFCIVAYYQETLRVKRTSKAVDTVTGPLYRVLY